VKIGDRKSDIELLISLMMWDTTDNVYKDRNETNRLGKKSVLIRLEALRNVDNPGTKRA
jgi:hypothetical protein